MNTFLILPFFKTAFIHFMLDIMRMICIRRMITITATQAICSAAIKAMNIDTMISHTLRIDNIITHYRSEKIDRVLIGRIIGK